MPEVKEYYLYDEAYASTSWTGEWLNISSSQRLSIIIYCSSSYTTTIEYAIDNNYRVISSEVSLNAVGTKEINIDSKTRFCRLLITSIVQPVILNIQAFFHNTNLLSKVITQGDPISVDTGLEKTSFGALHTEKYVPHRHYIFTNVNNGTALTASVPYSDIKFYDSGVNGTISENGDGLIRLSGLNTVERLSLRGAGYKYNPGQTLMCRYTGKFFQGEKDPGGLGCTHQCAGFGNEVSNTIENFCGFGYGDDTLPYSQENFGVIYVNRGVHQFFPKTVWNGDPCDGTRSSLNITDWNKINIFQVELIYLGGGNITFKIMDRETGLFVTVHTLFLTGTLEKTSLGDPNLGLYIENEVTAQSIPLLTTDSVEMGSFGLFIEGESMHEIDRGAAFNTVAGVTTETAILSIRVNSTWYGAQNHETIDIDIVTLAVDGSKNAIISCYKNATLVTPVWNDVNAILYPVAKDIAGTYTLATGQLLWANAMSKVDEVTMLMDSIHIHLDPGDTFTITCQSANATECSASIGFHAN